MPFHGFMSLAYLILCLIWFLRFVQHCKDVIQLYYHIKVVIGLGMCEMALWYFEYASFDVTGSRPLELLFGRLLLGAFEKTFSRLLLCGFRSS